MKKTARRLSALLCLLLTGTSVFAAETHSLAPKDALHIPPRVLELKSPTPTLPFQDVKEEDWFYLKVSDVTELGLFSGTDPDLFSPQDTMTRGMFVTVLGKLGKIDPADYGGSPFTDIDAKAYYAPYVAWAAEKALIFGTGDGRFSPEAAVTREQAALMLYRLAIADQLSLTRYRFVMDRFSDLDTMPGAARTAVTALYEALILSGKSDGKFDPKANILRCEAASLFSTAYYTLYDFMTEVPHPEIAEHCFFTLKEPSIWHGRVTYEMDVGFYFSAVFDSVTRGNIRVLNIYNSAGKYDRQGLAYSIYVIEDKIQYTNLFQSIWYELYDRDDFINKIRYQGRDYVLLSVRADSLFRYYDPKDHEELDLHLLIETNYAKYVRDSIQYIDGVEILPFDNFIEVPDKAKTGGTP